MESRSLDEKAAEHRCTPRRKRAKDAFCCGHPATAGECGTAVPLLEKFLRGEGSEHETGGLEFGNRGGCPTICFFTS